MVDDAPKIAFFVGYPISNFKKRNTSSLLQDRDGYQVFCHEWYKEENYVVVSFVDSQPCFGGVSEFLHANHETFFGWLVVILRFVFPSNPLAHSRETIVSFFCCLRALTPLSAVLAKAVGPAYYGERFFFTSVWRGSFQCSCVPLDFGIHLGGFFWILNFGRTVLMGLICDPDETPAVPVTHTFVAGSHDFDARQIALRSLADCLS